MKFDMKKLALGVGLVGLLTLPASAELVAGWDFSDLSGDSAPVPGGGYAANYAIQATASSLNVTGDVVASTLRPGASVRDPIVAGALSSMRLHHASAATETESESSRRRERAAAG